MLSQAQEAETWRYFRTGSLASEDRLAAWLDEAIAAREKGIDYPFVTIDRRSGQTAGSTRFRLIDPANRSVEIGGTWLGSPFQGTGLNRHAEYLMLRFAFEELRVIRVQFRTDLRNLRSQRAIKQLGAVAKEFFAKTSSTPTDISDPASLIQSPTRIGPIPLGLWLIG